MTPNKIIKINYLLKINKSFPHFSIDSASDLCIGLLTAAAKNSAILAGLKKKNFFLHIFFFHIFFFYIFFFLFFFLHTFLKKANTLVFMLENNFRVNGDEDLELAISETMRLTCLGLKLFFIFFIFLFFIFFILKEIGGV